MDDKVTATVKIPICLHSSISPASPIVLRAHSTPPHLDKQEKGFEQIISSLDPNPMLGAIPPPISPSEKRPTRVQRTTLAQRPGHCRFLGDYKVLTGLCPECLFCRQMVPHIFQCNACPTQLILRDIWMNPVTVVEYLVTLSFFSTLIPPNPPPPP